MIKDVRVKKNSTDYVISILIYNKNINLTLIEAGQVLLIYEHMNKKL